MDMLWIGKEPHLVRNADEFEQLVRAHMGDDAAGYVQDLAERPGSRCGDCEKLDEQQQRYKEVIRAAVNQLKQLNVTKSYTRHLDEALVILEAEL